MSDWDIKYLDEAKDDLKALDNSVAAHVQRAITKTRQNPLPQSEGGYGKPLGNQGKLDLTGLLKVKLKRDGVRIVYKLERADNTMRIVIVGVRADSQVYREAARRKRRYDL